MRALLSRASKDNQLPAADTALDSTVKDARPTLRSFVSAFSKSKDFLRPPPLSAASSSSSSDASSLKTPTDDVVPDTDSPERAKYGRKASSSALSVSSASSKHLKRVRSFFAPKTTSASGGKSPGKSALADDADIPPVPPLPKSLALRPLTPPPPLRASRPISTPPAHPSDPPLSEPLPPLSYSGRPGSVAARVPYPHPRHIPVLIQTITRASLPPHTTPHPLLIHPPNTQLFPVSTRRVHHAAAARAHSHTSSPTLRRLFKFSVLARLHTSSQRPLSHNEQRELAHLSFRPLPVPTPTVPPQPVSTSGDLPPTRIQTCSAPPGVREFLRRESFHKRVVHWVWVEYEDGSGRWEKEEVVQSRGLRVADTREGCSPGLKALARGLDSSNESESSEEDEEEGDTSDGGVLGLRSIELKAKANGGKLLPPATITKAPTPPSSEKTADSYERERRKSTGTSRRSLHETEHERHPSYPGPPRRSLTDPSPAHSQHTASPAPPVPPLPDPRHSPSVPLTELGLPGSSVNPRIPASASLAMQLPPAQRELDWLAGDEKHRKLREREEEREKWKKAVVQARERSERERRGERGALEDLREGEGWDANSGQERERTRTRTRSGERERSRSRTPGAGSISGVSSTTRESRRSTVMLPVGPPSSLGGRSLPHSRSSTHGSLPSRRPTSMMILPTSPTSPSISLSPTSPQQPWMPMQMMPVVMPVPVPVLVEPPQPLPSSQQRQQQQQQTRASTMPRSCASWAPPQMPLPPVPLPTMTSFSFPSTPSMPMGFAPSPSTMHLQAAAAAQMQMQAAAAQMHWQMAAAGGGMGMGFGMGMGGGGGAMGVAGTGSAAGSERTRGGRRQTVDFGTLQQGGNRR